MKPGVTGWAQINGGRQNTAEEKGVLDEWYVRNASRLARHTHHHAHRWDGAFW